MNEITLKNIAREALLGLVTRDGVDASSREELYGCTFGRDTAITVLELLTAQKLEPDAELLNACRNALLVLTTLVGTKENIENGEQPGKFIHEFRRDSYEHLTGGSENWYLSEDKVFRNYDSIDATPLALIAVYRFWELTGDEAFLEEALPAVLGGLTWLTEYADANNDGLVDYTFDSRRKHGGLVVQSWTDSRESLMRPDGTFPVYPISPVEAQGYAWLAYRLWSDYYAGISADFSRDLAESAVVLKENFNSKFIMRDADGYFAAQAIDGLGNQITTITANPLLCLWAAYTHDDTIESIIDARYIPSIVARVMRSDMFEFNAGIRTMSLSSSTFNPNPDNYHNGSFWPMLNSLALNGFINFGFSMEALMLREASLAALDYYKTPIELYLHDSQGYHDYHTAVGDYDASFVRRACRIQAWSAAGALYMIVAGKLLPQKSSVVPLEPEMA